jgi:hypothetical protein
MTEKELWVILRKLIVEGKSDDEIVQYLADLLKITPKSARAMLAKMRAKYPELDIETDPEAIDADSPFPSEEEEPDQDESPKP